MNDILSGAGLAEGKAVQRVLAAWDDIFGIFRPDLVVADYAPLATLAARGRIPLVVVGNGFTVPPAEMPRFPLLHRIVAPAFDETQTLETVNAAAVTLGLPQLDRLPQLFAGDACLVHSLRLLDPYDTQRISPVDGPVFEEPPVSRAADAQQVFAYLSSDTSGWTFLLEALVPLAKRLRIYAPLWPTHRSIDLSRQVLELRRGHSRSRISWQRADLWFILAAAGSPRRHWLLVCRKWCSAAISNRPSMARRSNGPASDAWSKPTCRGRESDPDAIRSLIDDAAVAARADAIGTRLREFTARRDALANCEAVCMGLLKGNSA